MVDLLEMVIVKFVMVIKKMKCKKCGKTLDGAIYRGILCERCYEKSIGFLRVGSSGELKNYDG